MVFLRKAGYRFKVKKVLLRFAVGWDFSVEILERVGLHGNCFTVQNGYSGHVVPRETDIISRRNLYINWKRYALLSIKKLSKVPNPSLPNSQDGKKG